MPQTYNYKNPHNPKAVTYDELEPAIPTEDFFRIIGQNSGSGEEARRAFSGLDTNARISKVNAGDYPAASAEIIAEHCGQLRHFRDVRGDLPEPLWYAGLGVIAHCMDGVDVARAWSDGHPDYDEAATDRKTAQAKNASGPTTCERFKFLRPEGCHGCPHQVTSPIQLGREGIVEPTPIAVAEDKKPWLPQGFSWGPNMALHHAVTIDDGTFKTEIVSPFPIYLSAVRRGEKSAITIYEFCKKEPHRDWHNFEIPAAELYKMTWPAYMANAGANIKIAGQKSFRIYVEAMVEKLKNDADETIQFEQFGWKEEMTAFLVGDQLFKEDGSMTRSPGMKEAGSRAHLMVPTKGGSLEAWATHAQRFFLPGFEPQAFALMTSFAGCLMPFITAGQEGGAIFSMFSPRGAKGKSTVMSAIASIWGRLEAVQLKDADTFVGRERGLVCLGNIPPVYEELAMTNGKVAEDFVRFFTTGKGKSRGTRSGIVDMAPQGWETILISGSNISLLELLNTRGSAEPMSNRVFEVTMTLPQGMKEDMGRDLDEKLMENRGHAGRCYAAYIVNPAVREQIKHTISLMLNNFRGVLDADGTDRYLVRILACVGTACLLVNRSGILNFDPQPLLKWAVERAKENKRNKTVFTQDAVDILMRYISEHSEGCLRMSGPYIHNKPGIIMKEPRRELVMRIEDSPARLFISTDNFRRWAQENGYAISAVGKDLEDLKVIVDRNRMTQLAAGSQLPPVRTLCWEINLGHPRIGGARADLQIVVTDNKQLP